MHPTPDVENIFVFIYSCCCRMCIYSVFIRELSLSPYFKESTALHTIVSSTSWRTIVVNCWLLVSYVTLTYMLSIPSISAQSNDPLPSSSLHSIHFCPVNIKPVSLWPLISSIHHTTQSRRHWLSSFEFRRTWILGYLVFNALLYAVQVSLYSLMFMPSINQVTGIGIWTESVISFHCYL